MGRLEEILKRPREDYASHSKRNRFQDPITREDEFFQYIHASDVQKGHNICYSMRRTLAKLDTDKEYRTKDQITIHGFLMAACAPLIYGPALKEHEREILQFNGYDEINQILFISMPRRSGKTYSVAAFVAAAMICIKNVRICAVAPSFRAAGGDSGMMKAVRDILIQKYKIKKFETSNHETLKYKFSDDDVRQFNSYPAGAADKYVLLCPGKVRWYAMHMFVSLFSLYQQGFNNNGVYGVE